MSRAKQLRTTVKSETIDSSVTLVPINAPAVTNQWLREADISSSVSCASSRSPEDRDRSFWRVAPRRKEHKPQSVLLEPNLPLSQHRRQINEAGKPLSFRFVSVTMSAATTTVEATSAKS